MGSNQKLKTETKAQKEKYKKRQTWKHTGYHNKLVKVKGWTDLNTQPDTGETNHRQPHCKRTVGGREKKDSKGKPEGTIRPILNIKHRNKTYRQVFVRHHHNKGDDILLLKQKKITYFLPPSDWTVGHIINPFLVWVLVISRHCWEMIFYCFFRNLSPPSSSLSLNLLAVLHSVFTIAFNL